MMGEEMLRDELREDPPFILGLSGAAGSGKDTVAQILVERYGFVKVALADPLKRMVRQTWPFTCEQLWGPSERRSETPAGATRPTAREALQLLGTEWGRKLDEDVWINCAMEIAGRLLEGGWWYEDTKGAVRVETERFPVESVAPPAGVVISDVRFDNEAQKIKKAGGEVWSVVGRSALLPIGGLADHPTEAGVSPSYIDSEVFNDGDLCQLRKAVWNVLVFGQETGRAPEVW